ncbi:phospholipase A [Aliiglaciecola aliphaticivorans]
MMINRFSVFSILNLTLFAIPICHGGQLSEYELCILDRVKGSGSIDTVEAIKKECRKHVENDKRQNLSSVDVPKRENGVLTQRLRKEQQTEFEPYVITPHRRNYIQPMLTTNDINHEQYAQIEGYERNLEDYEAKFQLSLKVPLSKSSLLFEEDKLYFGFTIQSWWQIYSDGISKPFRETNYMPEIMYVIKTDWEPFNANTGVVFGAEHLSNGRSQLLSRSWNRLYTQFVVEKGSWVFSLKPWIRLQEDAKEEPMASRGDDNPNIEDYIGNYEVSAGYNDGQFEYSLRLNHAIETGRGSAEVNFSFPLWGKFYGYASLFTGYGESLIDYNHKQTRFGLGIALNNVL